MKIRQVGAEFFYADGRTDGTKVIVAFRKFANAQKYHNFFFFLSWIRHPGKAHWSDVIMWQELKPLKLLSEISGGNNKSEIREVLTITVIGTAIF